MSIFALAILAMTAAPLLPTSPEPITLPTHQVMAIQPMVSVAPLSGTVVAELVEPTPAPTRSPVTVANPVSGSKTEWLAAAGIPESVWNCADALISRESGWRVNATNPSSGAYGIPQALPGSKMAAMGADWQTNPVTQLRWMAVYVAARYGGWCQANAFQLANHWY